MSNGWQPTSKFIDFLITLFTFNYLGVPFFFTLSSFLITFNLLSEKIKETFELAPRIVVLETGTLAKEFEANIKAARFVDRRG